MSTLEAISIQGIRRFDPNNAQVLEFLNPVTIIRGRIGSGKTTIIECLKFATTGDFPPRSKVGGSFVLYPKLAHESEVKAKISLDIRDLNGNKLNVSRALKATQKDENNQVSWQTLDRTATDGSVVSISSKCVDINSEMSNSLGVSKTVLKNVIFCNQEESNWPLMKAKEAKERFDDIFATTKYVEALGVIRKIMIEKKMNVKEYKTELEYLNKRLSKVKELENSLAENKRFEKKCVEEALITLEKKIMKNDADIKHNIECISEMEAEIGRCNSMIGNNKIKIREMEETVAIRQCQSSIVDLEEEIRVLNDILGAAGKRNLESQLIDLNKERSTIQDEVYSIGATDLEKFYKALDNAIMHHHKAKMKEVNKVLKELWKNTYSREDIDYIEICSDEEGSGTGLRRRNYNYRVVMVKSGVRLDLRGRCSAGQKVLANLLIRLALAEVFCPNCGILSLDDPTTNLDRETIKKLALTLMRIVEEKRSEQKKFQLIMITNDDEFLKVLAKSDYVEEFYNIERNSAGYSEIQRTRIDHR